MRYQIDGLRIRLTVCEDKSVYDYVCNKGLEVFMTAIPRVYAFREAVGYVTSVDGISMQVCFESLS